MRILVVTTRSPVPVNEGRALRTFNLLRAAAGDHEIILCTYVQSIAELDGLDQLREFCAEVHGIPLYLRGKTLSILAEVLRDLASRTPVMVGKYETRAMRNRVREILARLECDVVCLDMLHLGTLLEELAGLPTVLVEHNVESVLLKRRVERERNAFRRAYLSWQQRKLERFEARVCGAVDHVVAVSEDDAALIRRFAPGAPVTVVTNGVDTDFFSPRSAVPVANRLVYVGSLSWFPNFDAIEHFIAQILPRIEAQIPDISFTMIGHIPPGKLPAAWAAHPRVKFTGLVEDIRPIVAEAAAYIVPLRVGGGTRLKILDALALGKAIVSTSIGCEGLGVTSGQELVIADGDDTFAREVVRVLKDRALAQRLEQTGRAFVERNYRWSSIARKMDQVYRTTARIPASPEGAASISSSAH